MLETSMFSAFPTKGTALVCGKTGIGLSSLLMQAALYYALERQTLYVDTFGYDFTLRKNRMITGDNERTTEYFGLLRAYNMRCTGELAYYVGSENLVPHCDVIIVDTFTEFAASGRTEYEASVENQRLIRALQAKCNLLILGVRQSNAQFAETIAQTPSVPSQVLYSSDVKYVAMLESVYDRGLDVSHRLRCVKHYGMPDVADVYLEFDKKHLSFIVAGDMP